MGYWDATDEYLNRFGRGPICSRCGRKMFPQDDHGRFACICSPGNGLNVTTGKRFGTPPLQIPQKNVVGMSDEEKAKVPPINRFEAKPTAAETAVLSMLIRGPEALNDPKYGAAIKAMEEERKRARKRKE